GWIEASNLATKAFGKKPGHSRLLRRWACILIDDHDASFDNPYGHSSHSAIEDDDFQHELFLHLQSCAQSVKAADIVQYTSQPDVLAQLGRTQPIALRTVQKWMSILGFWYGHAILGQYKDSHERADVVEYRQNVYLPALAELEKRSKVYDNDGREVLSVVQPNGVRPAVIWTHDESIYRQNDQPQLIWNSPEPSNIPQPKGEGRTIMVADFVSQERGFLTSHNGEASARILFEVGKNREGYFNNANVLAQASTAMNILLNNYPNEDHIFIFDNATTHTKRPSAALSVKSMTKFPPKADNFLVDVTGSNGEITKGLLEGARLPDGSPQSLYWPPGHPSGRPTEWWFKGTAQILFERGVSNAFELRAVCPSGCPDSSGTNCCCRRTLFNQPDFLDQKSALQELVESRGCSMILLPKYHCELNPIEQCWGASKRAFRSYGIPKSMPEMRNQIIESLDSIDIVQIRRFFNRAHRFADGYRKQLSGAQADWAMKKYHSHRVFPNHILKEVEEAGIF
ncbi:hypothetical protein BDV93DRAFT_445445, partial [Ceratobasidium sp. AG-I]